jgi:hypothetical protein
MRRAFAALLFAALLVPSSVLAQDAATPQAQPPQSVSSVPAPAPAVAPAPASVPVPPQAPGENASWSVGAGLGLGSFSLVTPGVASLGMFPGTFGSSGPIASSAPSLERDVEPSLNLFVERRIGSATWLLLQTQVSYDSATDDVKTNLQNQLTTANINLGARYVFNPGGFIEVSGFVLGGFGYSHSFQRGEQSATSSRFFETPPVTATPAPAAGCCRMAT